MKIAFISNYYNHHQSSFSENMYRQLNGEFFFISTERMKEERIAMGWNNNSEPNFVIHYYEDPVACEKIIDECDAIIIGSAPYSLVKRRLRKGKLTFLYSERVYKQKVSWLRRIKHKIYYFYSFGRFKNFYLLCSSAFSYADFVKLLSFKDRGLKWGYFPKTYFYDDLENIFRKKESQEVSILFVGRMIPLKHPEFPILAAQRLKKEGIHFTLTMVGNGVLKKSIEELISEKEMQNQIKLIDCLTPDQVREQMINSSIHVFTSDRNEGWGAVLNESMNSCCAVLASCVIGSVPFLLENNKNGLIYKDGDFEDFYSKLKKLCLEASLRKELGTNAYKTITEEWCAEIASKRLVGVIDGILKAKQSDDFKTGPCSKATIIKDDWFENDK